MPQDNDGVLSSLNTAINDLNLSKELASITPVKEAFGTVSALLTMIRVPFLLFCDEIFRAHT